MISIQAIILPKKKKKKILAIINKGKRFINDLVRVLI